MNVIVEEKLYDEQYIGAYTENWEEEKNHLKNLSLRRWKKFVASVHRNFER